MDNFLESEGNGDLTAYGDFGECNGPHYGFDQDKPCLFFRINKVIDWEPWGIFESDLEDAFTMIQISYHQMDIAAMIVSKHSAMNKVAKIKLKKLKKKYFQIQPLTTIRRLSNVLVIQE